MPSFFGLKRLSAGDIFFRRKKEQPSKPSHQQQRRSVSYGSQRPSIDYHSRVYDHDLATKFGDNVMVNDLELLLSMETQARMEAIEARERRARRLRFSLPLPPPRSPDGFSPSSLQHQEQRSSSGRWRQWRRRNSGSSIVSANSLQISLSSQEEHQPTPPPPPPEIVLSSRVQLIRRPLPTYGTVRFIGSVDFAPGAEWIGVELDSRVGKNDGSVKGTRYFDTDRDRGIFVLREDLVLILEDDSNSESDH